MCGNLCMGLYNRLGECNSVNIGVWHDKLGTLSGGCKCSVDSARALADEHEITLYSYERPLLKEHWDVSFPHKWIKLPLGKFHGKMWLYQRLISMFKSSWWANDEDILISTFGQTIFPPQGRLFQWLYFPFIPANWSFTYKIYRKPFDVLMNRTFRNSEKILVFSEYVKHITEQFYELPSEKIEVIPLSIDFNSFPEPQEKNDKLVVTTSSYCPWKHIEKVNEIACKCPEFRFVVIGRVTNSQYFNHLLAMREPNVSYLVDVPNKDVKKILLQARYYLHVNYNVGKIMDAEHFGIALIEGLAAGCTVLSHNSGGPVEILDKGTYGFLYNDHSEVPELLGNYFVSLENSRRRAQFYDFSQFRKRLNKVLFN